MEQQQQPTTVREALDQVLAAQSSPINRKLRLAALARFELSVADLQRHDAALVGLAELLGVDPDAWLNAAARIRFTRKQPRNRRSAAG